MTKSSDKEIKIKPKPKTKRPTHGKRSAQKTQIKKNAFIEAYRVSLGNATVAAAAVDMSRRNFYLWMEKDPEFAAEIDSITEEKLDFIEGKMMDNIKAGDSLLIKFALERLASNRGYIERRQIDIEASRAVQEVFELGGKKIIFGIAQGE